MRDRQAGIIQESYGIASEATEKQVAEWEKRQKDLSTPRECLWRGG